MKKNSIQSSFVNSSIIETKTNLFILGFRQLKTDEVSVSNCQGGVCKLKRNSDVTITLKFTPDRDSKNREYYCETFF